MKSFKRQRSVMAADSEWERIGSAAQAAGMEISRFIVQRALMPDSLPPEVMRRAVREMLGHPKIIELLMKANADISNQGPKGKTAVDVARLTLGEPAAVREQGMSPGVVMLVEGGLGDIPEPTCAVNSDQSCWMEILNRPGYYTWNPSPQPGETAEWSGGCTAGKASGQGILTWSGGSRYEGEFHEGNPK